MSGRREAPRAARQSRLAPVSSRPPINRTLGFPQSGCKRAPISGSVPLQHSQDGLTDQPECHGCARGWPAAFAAAAGHGHEPRSLTGTVPRRVIARNGHYARPFLTAAAALAQRPLARARLCCPRRHRYYGLSRQSPCLPTISRVCGYTPGLCHPVGCWLAWRPSPLCAIDPSLGATAHTPESPAGAYVRFLPRRRWPSPSTERLGAPTSTVGFERSQWEFLVDTITTLQRSLNAAAPSVARPLDQPTSTRSWSGRRDLYFRAFTRGGRPPSAPDMTTWAHRTSPRAGLAPAGSIRLRAAPVEVV